MGNKKINSIDKHQNERLKQIFFMYPPHSGGSSISNYISKQLNLSTNNSFCINDHFSLKKSKIIDIAGGLNSHFIHGHYS